MYLCCVLLTSDIQEAIKLPAGNLSGCIFPGMVHVLQRVICPYSVL